MKNRLIKLVPAYIIGILLFAPATPGFGNEGFDITLADGMVSVDAKDADVSLLLRELSARIGFKLWIPDNLQSEPISVRIDNQPIEKILRRMLADGSYALVYGDAGQVTALYVLPRGDAQSVFTQSPLIDDNALQQTLRNALESNSLPDNIKDALLNQANTDTEALKKSVTENPEEAIGSIIRALEEMGSTNSETMRQLRDKLDQQNSLQIE